MFSENFGKKMVDRFFRRVDDCLWDLMTGKVGVKTPSNEIVTLDGEGDEAQVVMNPFAEFGVPLPAFAQNTPVDQIKQGDLIYNAKKVMGWVVKVPEEGKKSFTLLKPDGTRGEWRPPKVQSIGLDVSGAMVLRSLTNTLPGGNLDGLQGMLLPMMMMGGGGDMEKMLPLLLMGQSGMGGVGGSNNMLQMMMMMKMLKGDKSSGNGASGALGSFFDM
jgi:hypothetical protein